VTLADTERGIALYEQDRHHAHAYDYGGHDTGVCAHAHKAITLWITGLSDQAARMSIAALELARRLKHPPASRTPHGGLPHFVSSFANLTRAASFRS
jgi:hypothetical protein